VSGNVVNSSRFKVLETSRQATLVIARDGSIQYLSNRTAKLLECEADEVVSASLWDIAANWREPLIKAYQSLSDEQWGHTLELYHDETGYWFNLTPVPHGELIVIYLEQIKDGNASRGIREQVHDKFRDQVREQSGTVESIRRNRQHDALHDSLTGFANRFGLLDILGHSGQWRDGTFLLLDIDRFQRLNDSLGPRFGDDLLIAFSQRLQHALRPDDIMARLGGDEFALVLDINVEEAKFVAERLQKSLEHPFLVHGSEVALSVSIGILDALGSYESKEDMLRDADLSLHHAKRLGKSKIAVFDPALRDELLARVALEKSLKEAINKRELEVYYQPIFDLRTNALVGLETLSRWHRPEGAISPTTFIRIAEETGFILDIDKWMIDSACQQMSKWQNQGFVTAPLNVNVSGSHFAETDMASHFQHVLETHDIHPSQIHLELTETVLMDEGKQTQQTLQDLQRLGIKLHIDDFGTGYASLSYLQRFSAHGLKIDRSFIAGLKERKSYELIRAIIAMAHALNMKVVAEGIETPWQLEQLKALGCDHGQGYLLAKPQPAQHIEPLLALATPTRPTNMHQALFKN
jgi:diguanylate cyclase (GGDEF)-like protein